MITPTALSNWLQVHGLPTLGQAQTLQLQPSLTFALLKPDALRRDVALDILDAIVAGGFKVRAISYQVGTQAQAEDHFAEHAGTEIFLRNVPSYVGEPIIPLILEGPEVAFAQFRVLLGATDPAKAAPGTLRARFAADTLAQAKAENRALFNTIHASDSLASVQREARIWMGEIQWL